MTGQEGAVKDSSPLFDVTQQASPFSIKMQYNTFAVKIERTPNLITHHSQRFDDVAQLS